ncbi:hypothetical protein D9613_000072 [Agrocybe pediades]|uniref:Uncharacterized protein n=1 Tax=Agrocybe pediades TaxID=84607 RepID=A0A8H4VSA4_9AGAR|nr:hypothetical protein D9613_000072 [Agrocybe pediades]
MGAVTYAMRASSIRLHLWLEITPHTRTAAGVLFPSDDGGRRAFERDTSSFHIQPPYSPSPSLGHQIDLYKNPRLLYDERALALVIARPPRHVCSKLPCARADINWNHREM